MLDVMRSSGPSEKGVYNQLHANAPIQPLNCDNLPVTSAHRLCAYLCRPTEQPAKPVACYYATTRPAFASALLSGLNVQRPCHSSFNPVKGKSREGDTKITELSER